jgi:uncharacterized membrane protein
MSKFSINRHPLHPALVTLPIGLMVWTFVCDVIYLATDKDVMWYDFSVYSGIAAVIAALGAALPGFGDYLTMRMRDNTRMVATAHMVLNLTVVALFFVAFLLMLDHNAVDGGNLVIVFILHLAGVGLVTLSGFLGGELVFKHHLAVVGDAREDMPEARRSPAPQTHHPQPR